MRKIVRTFDPANGDIRHTFGDHLIEPQFIESVEAKDLLAGDFSRSCSQRFSFGAKRSCDCSGWSSPCPDASGFGVHDSKRREGHHIHADTRCSRL